MEDAKQDQTDLPDNPRHSDQATAFDDAENEQIEQLASQLTEAEATIANLREVHLRERAELDNQRRRMQREVEQARKFASQRLLEDLLPVCDNLERGLAAEHANDDIASIREGVALTLKSLIKVMQDHGMVAIEPRDTPFDPELHEAMSMVDGEGREPGTVVAVLEKGYQLNGRLLRPARVVVARDA